MVALKSIDAPPPPFSLAPFRELYPWQGHWVARDGIKMHYLDEGSGTPLLFLHGNPTWSFYWRHLVAALSGDHRCVVPDHIGMGLSDKPPQGQYHYTLDSRVRDVDALVEHLDLGDQITLVLHDWGGMIGLAWAVRNPHRVRRLVLMNTAGFLLPAGRTLPWQLTLVKRLPFAIPVRGFNAFARGAAMKCSTRPGRMTPLIRRGYLAPYDSWAHRVAIHRFVLDIPLSERDDAWATVREVEAGLAGLAATPTLICWGERDFVFDRHFLAEWRRRWPDAEVHSFPDCGHYVLEDAPDEIGGLVREFLAAHPLPARPDGAAEDPLKDPR